MANRTTVRSSGVSFLGLLAVLFIGLKLGAVIDWSWWWVLAPLWAPWAVLLTIFLGGGFLIGVIALTEHLLARRRQRLWRLRK